ncbi:Crp/Fnr family transcriptional regulator [Parasporobacterium paucivorans]|uniref:cAMP-binding domain of CRP or a regulatory subunit of cAMP-dependent protein kinases n=1 Tax=Parasporobacterium paucivorans DSM 15970 TaxID=1122934 RepID=A0A1M6DLM6_9FIRM|nr:Crp/Fnr family transcriptional regulator [Parasporobacterium paucivorans]SHI73969.1 cAMP-binding domain of CRP or a regulatory subunit of cAMP-dependent protein kinases [Parasporobacterium paucivorans DSM 15970]
MGIDFDKITKYPIFEKIDSGDMGGLLTCMQAHEVFYKKGSFIALNGEIIKSIGLVLEGKIQMIKEDHWGNKAIFAVMNESDLFGESFIFSKTAATTVSFFAPVDCRVLYLSFGALMHTCSKTCAFHQQLIENMVMLIAKKNLQFIDKLEITSKMTLREKILTFLSQQAQAAGTSYFTVPMGRLEMAEYLCANRSALTRELTNMQQEGIIDYDKNTFRLL